MQKWSWVSLGMSLALVVVSLLAALGSRLGVWSSVTGLQLYVICGALALGFAVACSVSLVIAALNPDWKHLVSRFGIAVVIAAAFLAHMIIGLPKLTAPVLHDVTTDLQDPPTFEAAIAVRGTNSNSVDHTAMKVEVQRKLYPDLVPLHLEMSASQAFLRASQTVDAMGWELIAEDPERGRIEATARTPWFRFKDDVVVRVQERPEGGSVVDVRSLSRIGATDFGANAKRVRRFLSELQSLDP